MDLVRVQGSSVQQACRELGLPVSTMLSWLRKVNWVKPADGQAPLSEDAAVLRTQVLTLEARVKRLELEKEILKKATAFFAKEST